MKKVKNLPRLKKHHKRQLKKVLNRRRLNPSFEAVWLPKTPIIENYERPRVRKNWQETAVHLHPPRNMALFENPEKVINFFISVESNHKQSKDVFIHFEDVNRLTSDTVLLMVARTIDERFNFGQMVGGNMPLDLPSKFVFEESGIFGDQVIDFTKIRPTHGSIQRYREFQVSPAKAEYLTKYAATYFRSREQSAANYELLIELMTNTNMHAGGGLVQEELWWCSVYNTPEKALFNFLDNGMGICETATKRLGRRVLETLGLTDNSRLLEDIFNDKIESRTGKYYHGRGLPLIRRRAQKGLIENVIIITNNVFANVSKGEYRILNTYFRGTFIHWEVPSSNSKELVMEYLGIKKIKDRV